MNHITAKAATLSHSLKKNLGVYAPSSSTTDAEFDEASAQLKKTVSQVENIQATLKSCKQSWDAMRRHLSSSMSSNHGLISSRESAAKSKQMMTTVVGELETLERIVRPVVTGSEPGPVEPAQRFMDAEQLLVDYLKFANEVKAKVSKRESVRKELDYYRGKADTMNGVNASKKIDQDKLARTESACESLQAQYDALHDTTSMLVRHAIAVGDQTVACALAAYLYFQAASAEAMAGACRQPGEMQQIVSGPWPSSSDLCVDSVDGLAGPLSSVSLESASSPSREPTAAARPPNPGRPALPSALSSSSSDGAGSGPELARKPSRPVPPVASQPAEPPGSPKPTRPALPNPASADSLTSNGSPAKTAPVKPPRPSRLSEPDATSGGC